MDNITPTFLTVKFGMAIDVKLLEEAGLDDFTKEFNFELSEEKDGTKTFSGNIPVVRFTVRPGKIEFGTVITEDDSHVFLIIEMLRKLCDKLGVNDIYVNELELLGFHNFAKGNVDVLRFYTCDNNISNSGEITDAYSAFSFEKDKKEYRITVMLSNKNSISVFTALKTPFKIILDDLQNLIEANSEVLKELMLGYFESRLRSMPKGSVM